MFVYIKLGDDVRLIPDVYLHSGYLPMVGKVGGELQLEPAIWFKSFVIDSVLIDCDRKILKWCKDPEQSDLLSADMRLRLATDQQLGLLNFQYTLFGDDCTSFDAEEIDDLFESTSKLFTKNSASNIGPPSCVAQVESDCPDEFITSDQKTCEEILRLVHCYVLPAIPLHSQDLPELNTAKIFIETCKENTESEISQKDKAITLTETSLVKQRETLVHDKNFESEEYIRGCNEEFLMNFLHHIEKDNADEHEKLLQLQHDVDSVRDSVKEEDKITLAVLRKERDTTHQNIEKLCMIRENIKNAVIRPQPKGARKKGSRKVSPRVFHEIYLEITNRLRKEKESIHKLCLRKLKISSVREAIIIAIEELNSLGESIGWQYDGTKLATDVLAPDSKPKHWLSLGECIAEILGDSSSMPYKIHTHFCDTICVKIDGSIEEVTFFNSIVVNDAPPTNGHGEVFVEISVPNPDQYHSNQNDSSGVNQREGCNDGDHLGPRRTCTEDVRSTLESETSSEPMSSTLPIHAVTESVRSEIKKHLESMCTHLHRALQSSDNPDVIAGKSRKDMFKKIWLCYELHLYEKLKGRLNKLYEMTYQKKAHGLAKKIGNWTLSDLGIDEPWLTGNGQMEETMVKQRFPDDHMVDMVRSCPGPRRQSSVSKAISQMSLDDLYSFANDECVEIPHFVESMFDPDATEAKVHGTESDKDEDDHVDQLFNSPPPPYDMLPQSEQVDMVGRKGEESHQPPQYFALDDNYEHPQIIYTNSLHQVPALEQYIPVYDLIKDAICTGTIVGKVKNITKSFHLVNKQLSEQRGKETKGDNQYMPCCDEILTVLILILTKLTPHAFTQLYAHLNMMIDLMPPFIIGSVHDCSLTNFHSAFQYLFDRSVLQNTRDSGSLMYGKISFRR